jgi:hypothetical protein
MTRPPESDAPPITALKIYVPAKDFELSKRFYSAVGFTLSEGWGGTADFTLCGHQFRLQDYYVKEWAENCMMVLGVDDIEAWHQHVRQVVEVGAFPRVRFTPPEPVDQSMVLHLWDPSGVLLVFVQ